MATPPPGQSDRPTEDLEGAPAPADPGMTFTGRTIDEYTLVRPLGRGAMGQVYEARREGWQVRYALKILGPGQDAREAEIHQHFRHPNVVAIHDGGTFTDDDECTRHYIVMDLVQGARAITDYADEHDLDLEQRVGLVIDVCAALEEEIHRKGALHLDVKPANILVDSRGVARISDLGLSRLAIDLDVHRAGGTLTYMAPEQLELPVADLDQRADVYAVGATLYELATGLPPHLIPRTCSRKQAIDKKHRQIGRRLATIDPALDRIVQHALAPDRDHRTATIAELRAELRTWLDRRSTLFGRARRAWRRPGLRAAIFTVAAAVVATVIGGLIARPIGPLVAWETVAPAPVVDRFDRTRFVAFPDPAEVETVARELGIPGVRAQDSYSWRLMHAALCDRLAGIADTIVFDYVFEIPREADAEFAAAIERARDLGSGVVCGTLRRYIDDEGMPALSRTLCATGLLWGHVMISNSEPKPIIPLLTAFPEGTYPSLSLATFAASMVKRGFPKYELHDGVVDVSFWRSSTVQEQVHVPLPSRLRVLPSFVQILEDPDDEARVAGFQPGDLVAYQRIDVPPAPVRDEATVELRDVLTNDDITRALQDKIVLVFDRPRDTDAWLGDAFGAGAYVHAASIEALLAGTRARWLDAWWHVPLMLALGALGAWLGVGGLRLVGTSSLQRRAAGIVVILVVAGTLAATLNVLTIRLAASRLVLFSPVPSACALGVGVVIGLASAALPRPRPVPLG